MPFQAFKAPLILDLGSRSHIKKNQKIIFDYNQIYFVILNHKMIY